MNNALDKLLRNLTVEQLAIMLEENGYRNNDDFVRINRCIVRANVYTYDVVFMNSETDDFDNAIIHVTNFDGFLKAEF